MKSEFQRPDETTLLVVCDLAAPRSAVWRCWSEPELLKQWFCPKPWRIAEADLDLRPGGRMNVVMAGPDGERMPMSGVWLEVVEGERLTFTDSFTEGFKPAAQPFMTGFVRFEDIFLENGAGGGTRMTWGARHATAADAEKHLEMGYEAGWQAAAAQLEELARVLPAAARTEGGAPAAAKARVRTCLFVSEGVEEAARFYSSLLPDSAVESVYRPDPEGPPLVVEFTLAGNPFMALAGNPEPTSGTVTSISVLTADQAETDRLWKALAADGGEPGPCGWLKDRRGVHWQIVPETLPRLLTTGDGEAAGRVMSALMAMQKIDAAALEAAYSGR